MKKMILSIRRILLALAILTFVLGLVLRNPTINLFSNTKIISSPGLSARLKGHVQFLTNIIPARNFHYTDSLNKAAAYIKFEFEKSCDKVEYQNFDVNSKNYKNVICFFKGKDRRKIIIGAHYDVAGEQAGADDNASGVSGILELSSLIKSNNRPLSNDLEIVAYTIEEPPIFRGKNMGSFIHAKSLAKRNIEISHMISVEMIGFFNDEWFSQSYPNPILNLIYPLKGNFITLISGLKEYIPTRELKLKLSKSMEIPVYSFNAPSIIPGVDFSDHLNYWNLGHDAYMITDTSFFRNKNYHKTTDTIETLNFDKMAQVVMGIYALVVE